MLLNLENKSLAVFGLPDSGKSTLLNFLLTAWGPAAIVYDVMREYKDGPYDRYVPKDRHSVPELSAFIRTLFRARKYKYVVIDEANRFAPSKPAPLPQALADLNDFRAHYGLASVFVARRPVQLNQDLTELAHYLILFGLPGKNDASYLESIRAGLGEAVSNLKKYHFAVVTPERSFSIHAPIPARFATNKLRHTISSAKKMIDTLPIDK